MPPGKNAALACFYCQQLTCVVLPGSLTDVEICVPCLAIRATTGSWDEFFNRLDYRLDRLKAANMDESLEIQENFLSLLIGLQRAALDPAPAKR